MHDRVCVPLRRPFLQLETPRDVGLPAKAGKSKLLLHRKPGKPLPAERRLGGAAGGRQRGESGPGEPTGPHREVGKRSQEERNMFQSTCSCGISVQKDPVIIGQAMK